MILENLNLFLFPLFTTLILISILGYGTLINKILFTNEFELGLKNLIFIQGLIFTGFFFTIFNFFIPISNNSSLLLILCGILIYVYFLFKKQEIRIELFFVLFVSLLSILYSFYSGFNDDFNYHYETIKNYKNKNLFDILHHRRISYNSHWLFLNSIYSLSFFTSTLVILSSLFFSISIYDFLNLCKKTLNQGKYYISIISFFCLIFFLGALNHLKDLGTDIPGVIVSIYIILLITNKFLEKSKESSENIFLISILLLQFAFIIKISNFLVVLFIFLLIFEIKYRKLNYFLFLVICLIPVPWFFQNYIISGCLIWPVTITCFSNIDLAIKEINIIGAFAKGDQHNSMNLGNFNWILIWLDNHLYKILEIYFIYLILLFVPFLYVYLKIKNSSTYIIKYFRNKYFENYYIFLILFIVICNLIWFFFAPAYRFGIFYNLFLIIFLLVPLWLFMIKYSFKFITAYAKVILVVVFIYFIFENLMRLDWYTKRYNIWPPINQGELLERNKT